MNEVDLLALNAFILPDLGNQATPATAGRRHNRFNRHTVELELVDDKIGQAVLSQLVEQ